MARSHNWILIVGLAVAITGCASPLTTREKGALAGGAIGAGTGALIGSQTGHAGTGALIGGGIGALSGALIGDAIQGAEDRAQAALPPAVQSAPTPSSAAVVVPPPVVVKSPQFIWVPAWGVYVLEGYDIVYHDGFYYYYYKGRWYRSHHHAGPWTVVAPPPVVAKLPPGQFLKHLPPGRLKRGRIPPGLRH